MASSLSCRRGRDSVTYSVPDFIHTLWLLQPIHRDRESERGRESEREGEREREREMQNYIHVYLALSMAFPSLI